MNYRLFLDKVDHRTPPRPLEPESLTRATLRALGARLAELDRDALARQLPDELAGELSARRAAEAGEAFEVDGFYRAVADDLGAELGHAAEGAQIVCEILGEEVDEEGWRHLTNHLDAPAAQLFTGRRRGADEAPALPEGDVGSGTTLASGRPGSRDPVSIGSPGHAEPLSTGRPGHDEPLSTGDRTQADSVADDNPHGDRKLSSGKRKYEE